MSSTHRLHACNAAIPLTSTVGSKRGTTIFFYIDLMLFLNILKDVILRVLLSILFHIFGPG